MSASKTKNKKSKIDSIRELVVEIVVNSTESEFQVEKQSDDGGYHLMVYLPVSSKEKFDIKKFRDTVWDKVGSARVMLCFVHDGYIENFLRTR